MSHWLAAPNQGQRAEEDQALPTTAHDLKAQALTRASGRWHALAVPCSRATTVRPNSTLAPLSPAQRYVFALALVIVVTVVLLFSS